MQMNNEKSVREERPVLSTITSLQTYVGPLWSFAPALPALLVSVRVAQKFEIQMRDALSCPLTEGGGDAVHVACC
jgi:hypothetical protein